MMMACVMTRLMMASTVWQLRVIEREQGLNEWKIYDLERLVKLDFF